MINRSGVNIRPKPPYVDWATNLDAAGPRPDLDGEPSMYLIPEYRDDTAARELLAQAYEAIFDNELESWHTRIADWPSDRSFAMFQDWFDITFVSLIEDLCEGPIIDDDA